MMASRVSARMEDLSRPPVPSSPRPRLMKDPSSSPRATWARARELTFREVGVDAVEGVRHHQTQHRVAEELQALVGGQTTVLVRVRAVSERTYQEGRLKCVPEPPLQHGVRGVGVLRRRR
jgi:hypothetical protein